MTPEEITQSYAFCRKVARRQAKNFYWSFLALPAAKRSAMCAVYAFMRKADDISDNAAVPREQRLSQMQQWTAKWQHAVARTGPASADPCFAALLDTMHRFSIPAPLIDELIEGVTMDLAGSTPAPVAPYQTFDDLYRYCYLVASVVGLVCIRIFGYDDARAEILAERTGIAFQLTNILRDVQEDASMRRIYLPVDDMLRFGVMQTELLALNAANPPSSAVAHLLQYERNRAHEFYLSADELLPLIHADSRGALWVLVTTYRRLLDEIQQRGYDVFSERISVPSHEKIGILLRGIWRTWLKKQ